MIRLSIRNKRYFSIKIQRGNKIPIGSLNKGDKIEDFVITDKTEFKDFDITGYSLSHLNTNLKLHHFDSKDTNNSFAFHFNTPAYDSTGVFHILEHLTLAGSSKYKERDPFFKMVKRSLKTYMNAWTGNDFTMYPFATANIKDYKNLREVYYYSVFHPKLNYFDFLQEGWRLEPLVHSIEQANQNIELVYNGVVLNEMKGAMISPDTQFISSMYKNLFEGCTYQNNSGGDPEHIPSLSYDEILKAHKKYYSFDNCSVITYGDLGLNDNLQFLSENINNDLKLKEKLDIKKEYKNLLVNRPKKFEHPKRIIEYYQPDLTEDTPQDLAFRIETEKQEKERRQEAEKQSEKWKYAISFFTNDTTNNDKFESFMESKSNEDNEYLTFKLSILSMLLMEGPSSPFYRKFLETEIVPAYIHGHGYSADFKYGVMTIGFMGFKGDNDFVKNIEQKIFETLKESTKVGFEEKPIKEILHLLEYDFMKPKENFGISIYEKSCAYFTHSSNVFTVLQLPEFIARLKRELFIEKKKVFEELITICLLDNNHRVHMTLKPKKSLTQDQNIREAMKLKALEKSLSNEDLKKITYESQVLAEQQNSENLEDKVEVKQIEKEDNKNKIDLTNIKELPSLNLIDIPKNIDDIRFAKLKTAFDIPLIFFPQNTNNLSFIRIRVNLKNLPTKHKQSLLLYSYLLPRLGTKTNQYKEFQNKLNTNTSGLSVELFTDLSPEDDNKYVEYMLFEISFLNSNLEQAMNLFSELISEADFFDLINLNNVIKQKSIDLANDLSENELKYAREQASSVLRPNKLIYNQYTQELEIMKLGSEILKTSDSKKIIGRVIEEMVLIHNSLFIKENLSFSVHGDKKILGIIENKISLLCNAIKNENPIFNEELQDNCDISKIADNAKDVVKEEFQFSSSENSKHEIQLTMNKDNNNIISIENLKPGIKQVIKTSSLVSNCVEAFIIPNYKNEDYPKIIVAANLLALNYLHKEIREKGGAYGSGAKFNSGICYLFSYRDPNPHKTYTHFEKGVSKISKGKFSDQDIEETKLYIFSDIDNEVPPQEKGLDLFIKGYSIKDKNEFREQILNTTKDDIIRVTKEYFYTQMEKGQTARVLFGNIKEQGVSEVDDYFKSNEYEFIQNMSFLEEEYFEEKEE